MRLNLLFVYFFLNVIRVHAQEWKLIWSDEFDSIDINLSNWSYDVGGTGWGNHELQYYTKRKENVRIENGNLLIEARKENYKYMSYTSARLKTQNLQNWKYCKIEARIKLPVEQGIWPAFWLLGQNKEEVGWPKCGEIDIMEHVNLEPNIHGTIHWFNEKKVSYGTSIPCDVTAYHVYSIEWNATSIKWFLDGIKYLEADITNDINSTEEFHQPFFILLNLAIGGDWPKEPDKTTQFPVKMYVDYVRVYQNSSTR